VRGHHEVGREKRSHPSSQKKGKICANDCLPYIFGGCGIEAVSTARRRLCGCQTKKRQDLGGKRKEKRH